MHKAILTLILLSMVGLLLSVHPIENTRVDTTATIESFSHLGEFHTINYIGDYEEILDYLDDLYLGNQCQCSQPLGCSLFSGLGDIDNIFLGRNFDNPQQDVLVGKYSAPGCYESVALNRLADMGLVVGTDFQNLTPQQELLLLRAPYFAADGINEMGLVTGIAYVDVVPVDVDPEKETIWLTRWVREVLDHAGTIEEAIQVTNSYNILDNFYGQNTLCHHMLITDSNNESVILEYHDGGFEAIYPDENWQVLTNTSIYNHTLQQLFSLCWRYQLLYNTLEDQNGVIADWENGLDILELPTWGNLTNGTQWSGLYDINDKSVYLALYRDFENISRVDVETFTFLNFGNFYLYELTVMDGNGNELIEPGEEITLLTFLTVDFLSSGVSCELSCDDPDVNITVGNFYFGDIEPDQLVSNLDQFFAFEIDENIASDQFTITLNLETDYGYQYEIDLPFEISGVDIENDIFYSSDIKLNAYPNPFNPSTTISFSLLNEQNIELTIYNLKGQKVKTLYSGTADVGEHTMIWEGKNESDQEVSSGIYIYQLRYGSHSSTRKMVLMK